MGDPTSYYSGAYITSSFGPRNEYGGFHHGEDFAHPQGTPVPALYSGKVVKAGLDTSGQLGNEVVVESTNDKGQKVLITYGHLADKLAVQAGQSIGPGDVLGAVGGKDNASALGEWDGPHTHVGIQVAGSYVDPNTVIPALTALFKAQNMAGGSTGIVPDLPNLNPVSGVTDAVGSVAGTISDFYKLITNGKLYWTAGFIFVGLGITALGAIIYLSSFREVQHVEREAATAAAV